MATFRGTIRPTETREIAVEVPDGADATEALKAEVPEGWQLISMRRDRS